TAKDEVSLRDIIQPHESDAVMYELKPNTEVVFKRAKVKINSYGSRGPERPIQKPEGTYRVALLGDSFAFGWGVEQGDGFAQVLEDELNKIYKDSINIEVINFGTPGYSTLNEVEHFLINGWKFSPDAVL